MATIVGVLSMSTAAIAINQITNITTNVCSLINNIVGIAKLSNNVYQVELIKVLTKTDIEATLKLLHAIIIEIPFNNLENEKNQYNSIVIALENMKDIISKIEEELKNIHTKIEYNSSLYLLSNIRSYDCMPNLEKIETLVLILDRRFNYLYITLKILKNYCNDNLIGA
jgi:hypothetical protein